MRARKIITLVLAAISASALLLALFTPRHQPEAAKASDIVIAPDLSAGLDTREINQSANQVTRIDLGNLALYDGGSGATLDTIVDDFGDKPVIIAVCHTVDSCLKARLTLEPLAQDDNQELFAVAILESHNNDGKDVSAAISYVFGVRDCMDMGATEYTSSGLLTAARRWHDGIEKQCPSMSKQP